MDCILSIGNILADQTKHISYRVIAISYGQITLCELNCSNFNLIQAEQSSLMSLINEGSISVVEDDEIVFNEDNLTNEIKEKYQKNKSLMNELLKEYGPTYMELVGRKGKPKVVELQKKYNISKCSFWRLCCKYFQSGLRDSALIDSRHFGNGTNKEYSYSSKTGRSSEYIKSGIIISDEVKKYFDEALKDYKSGRHKTIKSAFDKMNLLHFTKTVIVNGKPTIVLAPESERPTFRQFSYYFNKHLTNQEKDLIKTSAMEQKNNKRLLLSDSLNGVKGPGDLVEIDACEADISLVSVLDPTKTVGRPIVYFMIDVYSRIILAASVAFDNNSILGLTNLFLNLADDKQEYCARYGITYDNPQIWPSNIIPNRVRCDRGAEFRGKEFERICNELGIERLLVLPGSGSMKGVVEQSFRQLHLNNNVHLEDHGLIQKRHDSDHHRSATLNIEEYTKMVISFILTHNQKCLETYPITKNMIENRIKPIPALLWEYGLNNCYIPRPIPSKEQYLFNLMTPINAKVTRKGITYKGLWYINPHDKKLAREMFDAGNKHVSFEARMDTRDVGYIYYLRNNKLAIATLNPMLNGNADYSGMTLKQYEDYLHGKNELLAEGRIHNEELSAFGYAINHSIVKEADKQMLPDPKNIRESREIEKQAKSQSNKISKRLKMAPKQEAIKAPAEPVETKNIIDTYSSWEEALEDF